MGVSFLPSSLPFLHSSLPLIFLFPSLRLSLLYFPLLSNFSLFPLNLPPPFFHCLFSLTSSSSSSGFFPTWFQSRFQVFYCRLLFLSLVPPYIVSSPPRTRPKTVFLCLYFLPVTCRCCQKLITVLQHFFYASAASCRSSSDWRDFFVCCALELPPC